MSVVQTKQKNVERLIARCEDILAGRVQFSGQEWKLAKYVSALDSQINELDKYSSVDQDVMRSFRQRAAVLHGVLWSEKEESELRTNGYHHSPHQLPHAGGGSDLLHRASARKLRSEREELFAKTTDEETTAKDEGLQTNLQEVLHRHHQMQDGIANDMVAMAHSLRHNAQVAKEIIVRDKEVLDKTNRVANSNIEGMEQETDRLKERNRRCSWGVWLMLIIVFIVFIAMVTFIRVVPKPSSAAYTPSSHDIS